MAPLSRAYWKVYSKFGVLPGEERALRLNEAQVRWCYENILLDDMEKHNVTYKFLDWFKWYVNPKMAKWVMDQEKDSVKTSMEANDFAAIVAEHLKSAGYTPEEIVKELEEKGLIEKE